MDSTLQAEITPIASLALRDALAAMPPSASPASPIMSFSMVVAQPAQLGPIRLVERVIASRVPMDAWLVHTMRLRIKQNARTAQLIMEYQTDHVCNAALANTPTEATFLVFLVPMDAQPVLDPSTTLPQPAAIAQPTLDTQTDSATPVPKAKLHQAINQSAAQLAAAAAMAQSASAVLLTSSSASIVACNVPTAPTPKQETQPLVSAALLAAQSVIALDA